MRTLVQAVLGEETRNVQLDLREYKTSEFWEDILQDVFVGQTMAIITSIRSNLLNPKAENTAT